MKACSPKRLVRVKNCHLEAEIERIKVRSVVGGEFVLCRKTGVCFGLSSRSLCSSHQRDRHPGDGSCVPDLTPLPCS